MNWLFYLALLAMNAVPSYTPLPWNPPIFFDTFKSLSTCDSPARMPDGTMRDRLLVSDIQYTVFNTKRTQVNVKEYNNVFGYNNAKPGIPADFPGVQGSQPTFLAAKRYSYIALHFKTPAVITPGLAAFFRNPSGMNSPYTTAAISLKCGDFSQHLPTPGCVRRDVYHSDTLLAYFQFTTNNPATACNLKPNTDYYFNIMQSNPIEGCTAVSCPLSVWRAG